MTSFGDAKRADAARRDLPGFIGSDTSIGLILLDDDHREQPLIEGIVVEVRPDTFIFRRFGQDEEIPLTMVSKRVHGDSVVSYGVSRG